MADVGKKATKKVNLTTKTAMPYNMRSYIYRRPYVQ